ncbi:hypothetical protein NAC44_18150 [Allorhizobium sp. BGMRC 0089]|nr:hypothetical protein [Allorhizobium sonneratiae]
MRVRMLASGINPSDLIPITGAYGHRITPPMMAGYEGVTAPCAKYGAQRSL